MSTNSLEGFKNVVFWGDFLIFIFGFYVGCFIMSYLICNLFLKTKQIDDKHFEKINFVNFKDKNGKKTYFINLKNGSVFEVMRGVFLILFSPSFLLKGYVLKNEKVANIFIGILFAIGIIITILAIHSTFTFVLPPTK